MKVKVFPDFSLRLIKASATVVLRLCLDDRTSFQKPGVVNMIVIESLSVVSSGGDMVYCFGKLAAKRSCHDVRPCLSFRWHMERSKILTNRGGTS